MTKEEIQSAKSLCEKATEGPWGVHVPEAEVPRICNLILGEELDCTLAYMADEAEGENAAFLAASRTLLPKALNALEAAYQEIERLAKIVSKVESELCGPRVDPSCVCCDETRRILGLPIWESTT